MSTSIFGQFPIVEKIRHVSRHCLFFWCCSQKTHRNQIS